MPVPIIKYRTLHGFQYGSPEMKTFIDRLCDAQHVYGTTPPALWMQDIVSVIARVHHANKRSLRMRIGQNGQPTGLTTKIAGA